VKRRPALAFVAKMLSVVAWFIGGFFAFAGIYVWFAGSVPEYEGQDPRWVGVELIVAGALAWIVVKSVAEILETLINIERNTWILAKAATGDKASVSRIERRTATMVSGEAS